MIIWSKRALLDLEAIYEYVAKDSPIRATHFVEQLLKATRHLPQFPLSGKTTPETNSPDIREIVYQGYRIIYRLNLPSIEIITVFNGCRDTNSSFVLAN